MDAALKAGIAVPGAMGRRAVLARAVRVDHVPTLDAVLVPEVQAGRVVQGVNAGSEADVRRVAVMIVAGAEAGAVDSGKVSVKNVVNRCSCRRSK